MIRKLIRNVFCDFNVNYIVLQQRGVIRSSSKYLHQNQNSQNPVPVPVENSSSNWKQIYRLPLVQLASSFNRLKIYQFGLTSVGIPAMFALESSAILPEHSMAIFSTIGLTGFITLTIGSLVVQNLIGVIYINEEADKVKIAYVDFWGRRKDVEHKIEDLEISEISNKIEFYQSVSSAPPNAISFKLLRKFAIIKDADNFSAIFGSV